MSLGIGVDVGGTKVAAGLVTDLGEVVAERRADSPADDVAGLLELVAGLVLDLRAEAGDAPVTGVGIGAAAFVDAGRRQILFAPNLAWLDLDLAGELTARTGLPTVVENDANAAAWGEHRFGAGRGFADLLLVTVGTGVGGGIVLDGELFRGAFGVAAEVGHVRVVRDGLPCGCGNHGCLEAYASGSALERVAGRPGREVTAAAQAGDAAAIAQLAELGGWLGEGIATLAAVLDPGLVVLGGGVSAAGDLLLAPTRAAYRQHLTGRGHRPEAELRIAQLGNRAGMVGAADLARG